ncbi:hypothetical protein AAG570_003457 [Ranatra chinensis]|uniref:Solute carrier family 35 member F6 n=1 Tax=Ranatra chinensis TaxID=642074 RepID=A0ABD0Y3P2_9HEMI
MAWTPYQMILAVVMVITGSINTLSTKWADHLKSVASNGELRPFNHPFVQACAMFLGEFLCLIVFKIIYWYYWRKDGSVEEKDLTKGNQNFNPFIFFPPAMCDMIGTSIMYIGLNFTYASSFQMFRGSVIVFVALLSMLFLKRRIAWKKWLGIIVVILGLAVVGVSDFISPSSSGSDEEYTTKGIITGDLLIVVAQIITALQMVYEEKFVAGRDIPALQAVGWEGLFGLVVLGILQIPFYFISVPESFSGNPRQVLEDFPDAMVQLGNNGLLILSIVGTIVSIAFFNFAGISVTKELSATTRMILDSVRTLFIWLITLGLRWQDFHPLQVFKLVTHVNKNGLIYIKTALCTGIQ